MKVKVLSRNPDEYLRETKNDIHKVPRNYDPKEHPFESVREYVRALNATKLERVFAKPFIGVLDGHRDGISCFAKHPESLSQLCSGSYDGEIRIWDLPTRKCLRNFVAHAGFVRGISYSQSGSNFITVGDDKTVKTWSSNIPDFGVEEEPINTCLSRTTLSGISHHRTEPIFATCGEVCSIWEETRNEPLHILKWGCDNLNAISFNQIESDLLAACASDRSIILYDRREAKPIRKLKMTMRSNSLCWNPMEAFTFTVANEDYNLYTFDTRRLQNPLNLHKGHVSAVLDVDYAPTGREFVTASYDKTIRIYESRKANSREIYYTKRMHRVTCAGWSGDNKYIYTGSDEMNIRLWKARASEKLGPLKIRERAAFNYNEALKEKFAAHPQIRRIAKHRHVPRYILNNQKRNKAQSQKEKKKEANRVLHSKKDSNETFIPERNKKVIEEEE